jgi:hypothetical protein
MNMRSILLPILLFTVPNDAFSFESRVTANQSWNDSAGFPSTYERLAKATIAEIIQKKRNGFYDSWDQVNNYYSSTAIGAQTVFTDSNLEHVQVNTTSCGQVSASSNHDTTSTAETYNNEAPCRIENQNANTP